MGTRSVAVESRAVNNPCPSPATSRLQQQEHDHAADRRNAELAQSEKERSYLTQQKSFALGNVAMSHEEGCECLGCENLRLRRERDEAREEAVRLRAALSRHVCQHVECSDVETHAGCHARAALEKVTT